MKKILILLAFLFVGCEATDAPKTEVCTLGGVTDIKIICVDGFKFVVYTSFYQGGITQFLGADGKPVTCSCGGRSR